MVNCNIKFTSYQIALTCISFAVLQLAQQQIDAAITQTPSPSLIPGQLKHLRPPRYSSDKSSNYATEQADLERIANMSSRVKNTDWPSREHHLDAEESVSLESSMLAPPSQQQQHLQQLRQQQMQQQQQHLSPAPIMSSPNVNSASVTSGQDHRLIPMQPMMSMQPMQPMQPVATVGQQSVANNLPNNNVQQQQQQQQQLQQRINENDNDNEEQRDSNNLQMNEGDFPDSFESNQADSDDDTVLFTRPSNSNTDPNGATTSTSATSAAATTTTTTAGNITNAAIDASNTLTDQEPLANDLQVAAGHHSMKKSHDSKYYMFAESKKKGEYDSGYKMGGHKMTISGHSSVHKGHASGHVSWSAKKGKGMHTWEYMHKDKKGKHGHHH